MFASCCLGEGLAWRGKGSGGVQGLRFRGGVGLRDGANFATCVVFLSFQGRSKFRNVCRIFGRKMAFFEGCPVGGRGAGWQFQRRGRVGAWLAVPKRGKSRQGLACLAVPQEGARARGGIQGLRFRKGRCVIFRKLEG